LLTPEISGKLYFLFDQLILLLVSIYLRNNLQAELTGTLPRRPEEYQFAKAETEKV
jgi:hypothetical protein